ncbi:hypothetical protein AGMMS50239_15720 [Bacteroidia bacterium]|nr:hypothetical protein AGMMS50239_15720 [Bacteroidia bacterium]
MRKKGTLLYYFVTAVLLLYSHSVACQSPDWVIDYNIDKKTADLELTDSLLNFRCEKNDVSDSIYISLFSQYAPEEGFTLGLIHRRYGTLPPEINIAMKDFICMFFDDFDFYISIVENEEHILNFTIILKHKTLQFIHMLLATTNKKALVSGKETVKADFYTYIPQHSLKKQNTIEK